MSKCTGPTPQQVREARDFWLDRETIPALFGKKKIIIFRDGQFPDRSGAVKRLHKNFRSGPETLGARIDEPKYVPDMTGVLYVVIQAPLPPSGSKHPQPRIKQERRKSIFREALKC